MPSFRAPVRLAAAGLAALLALGAGEVVAQSVLRVRPFSDLRVLDPVASVDYAVRNHGYLIYDTLFAADESLTIPPQMVDRCDTSADGLTWTVHLRASPAFHDGQPVTATDVVASLRRWMQRSGQGTLLQARMSAMEENGADSFRIILRQPWGCCWRRWASLPRSYPSSCPRAPWMRRAGWLRIPVPRPRPRAAIRSAKGFACRATIWPRPPCCRRCATRFWPVPAPPSNHVF